MKKGISKLYPATFAGAVALAAAGAARAAETPAATAALSELATPGPLPAAPERSARNVVYFEVGGNGLLYSLNYERFVNTWLSLRAGTGYFSLGTGTTAAGTTTAAVYWLPLLANYLGIGTDNHKLELGLGVVPFYFTEHVYDGVGGVAGSGVFVAPTASIAYRYVPLDGGFNFKLGIAPVLLPTVGLLAQLSLAGGVAF